MNRTLLLNPGPVTLSDRVRQALLQPDLCHRESEFAELTLDIKHRLLHVYPEVFDEYEVLLLTGSGTCAVEAMLASLVPQQGKALVVTNGVYGERMASMIAAHGKPLTVVRSPWFAPMNLAEVERVLQADAAITHVVAVHHETTVGRLNNLEKLGHLCQQYNVGLLLDSVSSFGAELIHTHNWHLEACAATANKCLHGIPGVSFVFVRRTVLATRPSAANCLYLDLYRYDREQQQGYSPFTPSVHGYYALQAALEELEELGGWAARHDRYRNYSQKICQGLQALGINTFLPEADSSCVLRSFGLPVGYSYDRIHDALKQLGFTIYAGQGELRDRLFRIANMGDLTVADLDLLLAGFEQLLSK